MPKTILGIIILGIIVVVPVIAEQPPLAKEEIRMPGAVVKFEMVKVPAGKVTLKDAEGKEATHEIKPFWIATQEVTWEVYDPYWLAHDIPEKDRKALFDIKPWLPGSRPSRPHGNPRREWGENEPTLPASSIHEREAQRFVEWLSAKSGKKYRLPTEAEWEYACRAGGAAIAPNDPKLKEEAVHNGDEPARCGSKKPNAWGIYDMLGNVAEWVTRADGKRVLAGGAYDDDPEDVHSGARKEYSAKWQEKDPNDPKGVSWLSDGAFAGIRVVREE